MVPFNYKYIYKFTYILNVYLFFNSSIFLGNFHKNFMAPFEFSENYSARTALTDRIFEKFLRLAPIDTKTK